MKTRKIIHIVPNLSGGGVQRRMGLLARYSAFLGNEVHIIFFGYGDNASDVELENVTLHKITKGRVTQIIMVVKILLIIRSIRPDVIHTWSANMDILGGFINVLTGIKWCLMESTSAEHYKKATMKFSVRRMLAKRAVVISNSKEGDKYWNNQHIRKRIIQNGIELDRIKGVEPLPESKLRFIGNDPFICFFGRLNNTATDVKNLDGCLRVIKSLKENNQPVKLLICGDGNEKTLWIHKVAQYNIQDYVKFMGYLKRQDVWAFMKSADAVISLSLHEGTPNVVLEAMADIPSHRQLLDDKDALIVAPKSPNDASKAVATLLSNKGATNARIQSAYRKVQEMNIHKMIIKYQNLYDEMLDTY